MSSSLNIVQDRLTRSRLAGDPPDVTIAPKLGNIGLMQFDRAAESIAAGEQAVEQAAASLSESLLRLNRGPGAPGAPFARPPLSQSAAAALIASRGE
jgi:NTE family protein